MRCRDDSSLAVFAPSRSLGYNRVLVAGLEAVPVTPAVNSEVMARQYIRRAPEEELVVGETKTRLSRRAVPLQAIALEALDQLRPKDDSPLLFPNTRGGHLDFRNFNRRHWKPVQRAVGIEPLRDLYDLRHTYATFALRAGVPVFALSRFMGSSIAMIDHHYGHLAHDSREHAVFLLDALALEGAVDAAWTPTRTALKPHSDQRFRPSANAIPTFGGRSVDVEAAIRRRHCKQNS
jgi:hypothetical protein